MKKSPILLLAALGFAAAAPAQTFVNGPFVTHVGAYTTCGNPIPGDGSSLENIAPLVMGTFGYTGSITGFRLADDFTVPNGQTWTINSFRVFGYQTGSTLTSSFTDARYRLWCGEPGNGGAVVVDFLAANQLVNTQFTNCFRATAGTIGNCTTGNTRPIMDITMNGNGLVLSPGTYWLEYALAGSVASGPFCVPITVLGQGTTGNAVQISVATGAVTRISQGVAPFLQGIPFEVSYTAAAGPAPEWETNDAAASVDFDGAQANARCAAGIATKCIGSPVTATIAGTAGTLGWDLALSVLPAVPLSGGGIATAGYQTVNINLADPNLLLLNGLTFAVPFPVPFAASGPVTLNFSTPPIPNVTAQSILIDPTNVDGFALSQAAQITTTTGTGPTFPIAGPAADDSVVTVQIGQVAPSCGNFGMPYFGVVQNTLQVHSNGYVAFDLFSPSDATPTAAEATYRKMVGLWHNLNPAAGGTITITNTGSVISVNYNTVFRLSSTSTTNASTYSIDMDVLNGTIGINGLGGVTAGTIASWLGISSGSGAVAGASTTYSAGATYTVLPGTMLYQTQTAITVPVISSITFTPNGSGGYIATTL